MATIDLNSIRDSQKKNPMSAYDIQKNGGISKHL